MVVETFCPYRGDRIAQDKDGCFMYLAETAWIIKSLQQDPGGPVPLHIGVQGEMQEAGGRGPVPVYDRRCEEVTAVLSRSGSWA